MNIYQRKDGRWEGRIFTKNSGNKRKYRSFFGGTKEEVVQKMTKFQAELTDSQVLVTVSQIVPEWFQSVQYRIKESTAANYRFKTEKHILPIFGEKVVNEISQDEIYQFIAEKQAQHLSNRYISDILILMKSIFRYAVRKYRTANPMDGITMPKKSKSEIRLLNEHEQVKLQRYLAEKQNHTSLGILLSRMTGLRIGELCALKWENIDLEKRILTVKETLQRIQCQGEKSKTKLILTTPKSESSVRNIPIPACLLDFLKKLQGKPDEFVLSGTAKPVEPRTLQYRFSGIFKNVNLASIHFHALRHIFASDCVKLGFDVKALSEILGHSSVEITLNRYVHSNFEQKALNT